MRRAKTIGIPSLIVAIIAGLTFLYVVYIHVFEANNDWILLLDLITLGLTIFSIALQYQKSYSDEKIFKKQMQAQKQTYDIQKEQLNVMKDIKANQEANKVPQYEPEWSPWPTILMIILIVLFIPFVLYVFYRIISED